MTEKPETVLDLLDELCGDLKFITLHSRETAYLQVSHIAGVQNIRFGGCRIMFTAGGHIDVCGTVEEWRLLIALANIKLTAAAA